MNFPEQQQFPLIPQIPLDQSSEKDTMNMDKNNTSASMVDVAEEEKVEAANGKGDVKTCELYGGAITTEMGSSFRDVSFFRQVPDHQEVYVDDNTDTNLIIEINQMQEVSDAEACRYFFTDLAEAGNAQSTAVLTEYSPQSPPSNLPNGSYVGCLSGLQHMSKFNETALRYVHTFVGLIRLRQQTSDILIIVCGEVGEQQDPEKVARLQETFHRALQSFKIVDMGLF